MHKLFASTNDLRGGDPICLDLSGSSESRIVWNKLVLINLNIDAKSIKNMKKVVVMRHHWSVQQLQYFFDGPAKRYPSTPIACSDVKKIDHVVERKYFVNRKGKQLMFNAPNCPMRMIRNDAFSLEKTAKMNDSSDILSQNLELHQKSTKLKKGQKFVANLTFDQFWSMEIKIKMFELENENLKKQNEELKLKLQSEIE